MFLFDTSTREAAIQDLLSRLSSAKDEELKEICAQTAEKLKSMTDEEFAALDFDVYKEDDDE